MKHVSGKGVCLKCLEGVAAILNIKLGKYNNRTCGCHFYRDSRFDGEIREFERYYLFFLINIIIKKTERKVFSIKKVRKYSTIQNHFQQR